MQWVGTYKMAIHARDDNMPEGEAWVMMQRDW